MGAAEDVPAKTKGDAPSKTPRKREKGAKRDKARASDGEVDVSDADAAAKEADGAASGDAEVEKEDDDEAAAKGGGDDEAELITNAEDEMKDAYNGL